MATFFPGQTDYIAQLNALDANYNLFKGRWYGPLASDPTLNPLGAAIATGDTYFNTSANLLKTYNGSLWQAADINTANLAANTGATLVGTSGGITVQASLNAKEATITGGTIAQYIRGDKSLSTFAADVVATVITGLSTATNAVITVADTVLSALGKLQKQISDHLIDVANPHNVTKSQVGLTNVDNVSINSRTGTAGATAFRNRLINGAMEIDQRNLGAAVTPTLSANLVDRWTAGLSVSSKLTFQQVSDAPAGFSKSLKISVASQYAPAVGDAIYLYQAIEGVNVVDIGFGTSGATNITISGYIKSSVPGTYAVSLRNNAANRSYIGTINVTTAWAQIVLTIPGDITGTWTTDNTAGLVIRIDLGCGTTFSATSGLWQAGNFLRTAGSVTFVNQVAGSTLNITGMQLEAGSVATTFERRSYSQELSMCQRYFCTGTASFIASSSGAGVTVGQIIFFPVSMRAAPTIALGAPTENTNTATINASTVTPLHDGFRLWTNAPAVGSCFYTNTYTASTEL